MEEPTIVALICISTILSVFLIAWTFSYFSLKRKVLTNNGSLIFDIRFSRKHPIMSAIVELPIYIFARKVRFIKIQGIYDVDALRKESGVILVRYEIESLFSASSEEMTCGVLLRNEKCCVKFALKYPATNT